MVPKLLSPVRRMTFVNVSRRDGIGRPSSRRNPQRARLLLAFCTLLSLVVVLLSPVAADKPTAQPLVTDLMPLPLSDQFTTPNQVGLDAAGDVFFTAGAFALFHRDSASGNRTRLLQGADPHPGFPGSVNDIVGSNLQVNSAGHAAMTNFFFQKNMRGPRGVFVYDGTGFQKVALRGEVAPGTGGQVFLNFGPLRINDNDQVAFAPTFEPAVLGTSGIFLGSPSGPPVKIAVIGETAPGTGGTYDGFQLLGLNNAGQVAFLAFIAGGTTDLAIFIATTSSVVKVVANGESAPGTTGAFALLAGIGNYALNDSGNLAFVANVVGGAPTNRGIWIGNASGPPSKLVANNDPTPLGGTFDGGLSLRGFNNSGKALFQSNPVGATSNHALFLKDLINPANVVFARNQAVPGGTTEVFFNTTQASLNNNGNVAFQAQLQGGPSQAGWFLGSATAPPIKIVLEGEPAPVGGTFGIAGANQPAQINSSNQVAFFADIIGPNAIGAFLWTPSGSIASIVNSNDTLPASANPIIRTFMPGASDDLLVFFALKAGGRVAAFTKPLKPGGGQITRIFGEGDTAPGIGGGLWGILANFGLINDNEEVAFLTNRVVGGSPYPAGLIFTHKPGVGLEKVAATGDVAPGAAGGTFTNFNVNFDRPPARINSLGQVVFVANIAGSAGNSSRNGVFIGSASGGVQVVARMNDSSPIGGAFANFNFGISHALNDAGQVAFRAVSQIGSTQIPALFVGSGGGTPAKVVAQGDLGPGSSTISIVPTRFQMNNAGQVAYVAGLTGGSSPEGLFLGTAGGPQLTVALVGDAAPGTGGGTLSDLREPDIELNNVGLVAFWAAITGASATSGCFLGSATAPPAARLVEGQSLPGGGAAGFILPGINNFIGEDFTLTDSGQMSIFVGNVTGAASGSRQVIASPSGVLSEFVTSDEKATGTGSLFGALFQSVAVNSDGRFFVSAILVDGPAKWGIFTDR